MDMQNSMNTASIVIVQDECGGAQDRCGGQQATRLRRRLRSTKVACCPPYLMALNASEKPSMTF